MEELQKEHSDRHSVERNRVASVTVRTTPQTRGARVISASRWVNHVTFFSFSFLLFTELRNKSDYDAEVTQEDLSFEEVQHTYTGVLTACRIPHYPLIAESQIPQSPLQCHLVINSCSLLGYLHNHPQVPLQPPLMLLNPPQPRSLLTWPDLNSH